MKELLLKLLLRSEEIGNRHEEAGDTECRDRMRLIAVFRSFLRPDARGTNCSDTYGLYVPRGPDVVRGGDRRIRQSGLRIGPVHHLGLNQLPRQRLAAFQDSSVFAEDGTTFDEFFGAMAPQLYDAEGNFNA